ARRSNDVRAEDASRREIDRELHEIDEKRRKDRAAYFKDEKLQRRELELLAAKEQADETARHQAQTESTIGAILAAVDDAEAFGAGFDRMFESLPEEGKASVRQELGARPADTARRASAADIARFSETEEGAAAVKAWGKDAPKKIAIVRE